MNTKPPRTIALIDAEVFDFNSISISLNSDQKIMIIS